MLKINKKTFLALLPFGSKKHNAQNGRIDPASFVNRPQDFPEVPRTDEENEIIDYINAIRNNNGRPSLQVVPKLCSIASTHAHYMAKTKKCGLGDNLSYRSAAYHHYLFSEINACGIENTSSVMNHWAETHGEWEVINDTRFNQFGVAVAKDNKNKLYVTVEFVKNN